MLKILLAAQDARRTSSATTVYLKPHCEAGALKGEVLDTLK
jgi:hypothetical protein